MLKHFDKTYKDFAKVGKQLESLQDQKEDIEKELKGHQGEGSSYRFQSTYTEEYLANQ